MPYNLPRFSWTGLTISHSHLLYSVLSLPNLLGCIAGAASHLPPCHSIVHHVPLYTFGLLLPRTSRIRFLVWYIIYCQVCPQTFPRSCPQAPAQPVHKLLHSPELTKIACLSLQVAEEAPDDSVVIAVPWPQDGALTWTEHSNHLPGHDNSRFHGQDSFGSTCSARSCSYG